MGGGASSGLATAIGAASVGDIALACASLPQEQRSKIEAALKDGEEKIQFGHIAREWRMKYAENDLKGGAVSLDKIVKEKYLAEIKKIDGFVSIQRVVCGGCNDFKLIVTLKADKFGEWEAKKFAPEEAFLDDAKKIEGITSIESQNFTFEALDGSKSVEEQDKEQGAGGGEQIQCCHKAREWRMKYAENDLKGSAVTVDKMFKEKYLPEIKKIEGFVSIQRAVCGGCNDFKLIIKVKNDKWPDWKSGKFAPEEAFLEDAKKVLGISCVEAQPFTFDIL